MAETIFAFHLKTQLERMWLSKDPDFPAHPKIPLFVEIGLEFMRILEKRRISHFARDIRRKKVSIPNGSHGLIKRHQPNGTLV